MSYPLEDAVNLRLLKSASTPILCVRVLVLGVAGIGCLFPKPFLIWKKVEVGSLGPRENRAVLRSPNAHTVQTPWLKEDILHTVLTVGHNGLGEAKTCCVLSL